MTLGFFLSFIGLCFAFVNGVIVPWLITRASAHKIMVGGLLVLTAGRAMIGAAHSLPVLLFADVLVALGGATSGSVLPSLFSVEAPPGGVGTLLGFGQSVHSAAGVVGPIASGVLFERLGSGAPAFAAAALCLTSCVLFVALVPAETGSKKSKLE